MKLEDLKTKWQSVDLRKYIAKKDQGWLLDFSARWDCSPAGLSNKICSNNPWVFRLHIAEAAKFEIPEPFRFLKRDGPLATDVIDIDAASSTLNRIIENAKQLQRMVQEWEEEHRKKRKTNTMASDAEGKQHGNDLKQQASRNRPLERCAQQDITYSQQTVTGGQGRDHPAPSVGDPTVPVASMHNFLKVKVEMNPYFVEYQKNGVSREHEDILNDVRMEKKLSGGTFMKACETRGIICRRDQLRKRFDDMVPWDASSHSMWMLEEKLHATLIEGVELLKTAECSMNTNDKGSDDDLRRDMLLDLVVSFVEKFSGAHKILQIECDNCKAKWHKNIKRHLPMMRVFHDSEDQHPLLRSFDGSRRCLRIENMGRSCFLPIRSNLPDLAVLVLRKKGIDCLPAICDSDSHQGKDGNQRLLMLFSKLGEEVAAQHDCLIPKNMLQLMIAMESFNYKPCAKCQELLQQRTFNNANASVNDVTNSSHQTMATRDKDLYDS